MASWHYAFFFPGAGEQLQPAIGIKALSRFGLIFDEVIRLLVAIDEHGHLLDVGEEVKTIRPIIDDLASRLEGGEQFSVQCRNNQIAISCTFAARSSNPHIFFGWSRRIFADLPQTVQIGFWDMIRDFAKMCIASYVVIADDVSDSFEDKFIEVNGVRVLDTSVGHSYGHGIEAVWVDRSRVTALPDGVSMNSAVDIGQSFHSYCPYPADTGNQ